MLMRKGDKIFLENLKFVENYQRFCSKIPADTSLLRHKLWEIGTFKKSKNIRMGKMGSCGKQ